jgi:hypothetical protein
MAEVMRVTRIYEDEDGVSHFGEAELPMALADFSPPAPPVEISEALTASRVLWYRGPAGWFGDWHPAPHRQLLVQLTGSLEVRVGDGERRVFGPGSVLLLEDTEGRGHVTRLHDTAGEAGAPWSVSGLFVQLP